MTPKVYLIVAVSENMGIGSKGTLPWRLKKELQHFGRLTRRTTEGLAKRNAVLMGRRTWESIPESRRPLPGRLNIVLSSKAELIFKCVMLNEKQELAERWWHLGAEVDEADFSPISLVSGSHLESKKLSDLTIGAAYKIKRVTTVMLSKYDKELVLLQILNQFTIFLRDCALPEGAVRHSTLQDALSNLGDDVDTAWIIGGTSVYSEALKKGLCDRLYVTRILRYYDCDAFLPVFGPGYRLTSDPDVPQELQEEDGIQYKFEVYEKDN